MNFDPLHKQNKVIGMIDGLCDNWDGTKEELDHLMKVYLIACAHAIWELLPQAWSRRGIEVAEQYLMGLASDDELFKAAYYAEAAAFNIDYNCSPKDIKKWVKDIKLIPHEKLCKIIHPGEGFKNYKAKKLLLDAAYFVDFVISYPDYISASGILNPSSLLTVAKIPEDFIIFLSPSILQEFLSSDNI